MSFEVFSPPVGSPASVTPSRVSRIVASISQELRHPLSTRTRIRDGFVGFSNYLLFLNNPAFLWSILNTLTIVGSVLIITLVGGILLALLLDLNKQRAEAEAKEMTTAGSKAKPASRKKRATPESNQPDLFGT